jgi:aminopeptidase C
MTNERRNIDELLADPTVPSGTKLKLLRIREIKSFGESELGLSRSANYESLYDTKFSLTKSDRLLYHQTAMNHAMLFTGVDVVGAPGSERPRRWRVENSWGEENSGRKGFYVMNDNWFDEHMFEIAANKKHLSPELLKALSS